jgi:hypothetical protein
MDRGAVLEIGGHFQRSSGVLSVMFRLAHAHLHISIAFSSELVYAIKISISVGRPIIISTLTGYRNR